VGYLNWPRGQRDRGKHIPVILNNTRVVSDPEQPGNKTTAYGHYMNPDSTQVMAHSSEVVSRSQKIMNADNSKRVAHRSKTRS
jgi:hypothetical protein